MRCVADVPRPPEVLLAPLATTVELRSTPLPSAPPIDWLALEPRPAATLETLVARIVEFAPTDKIFTNPDDKRTEDYVTGKVG